MHEPTPSPGRQHPREPAPPATDPRPAQADPGPPARPPGPERHAPSDGIAEHPEPGAGEGGGHLPVDEADEPDAPDDAAAGPRPLGVGTSPTGHTGIDTVLERLADADHLEVSDHLRVYEDVHGGLRDTLAALDRRPGPPPPPPGGAPAGQRVPTTHESNRS